MTELKAIEVSVEAGASRLVTDANVQVSQGEFVAMLGPNGAGKTTLIRAMLGLVDCSDGRAEIDKQNVAKLKPFQRAQKVSYLPQTRPLAWPIRVRDAVALGRFSHGAALGRLSSADAVAVEQALADCDLVALANRAADTLSGGERARMHLARAFAANAPLLVADEPIAALDPRHQFRTLNLIRDYVTRGGGALVVLHDVALAARYASRLVWMKGGRIIADGPPEETLSEAMMADIYGVRARLDNGALTVLDAM